jgi:predicted phage tail protein
MLDKWELYRIAQRCDQKVPDGKGGSGTEPRFMFDVYIQSQADAWQVIKDIAAGFNGMTFWGNNMFNVVSDMPADTSKLQILTRASVVGNRCTRAGVKRPLLQRLINFSDPDNHYQDRTTAVMFPDLVKQFKFKQTQSLRLAAHVKARRSGVAGGRCIPTHWIALSRFRPGLMALYTCRVRCLRLPMNACQGGYTAGASPGTTQDLRL